MEYLYAGIIGLLLYWLIKAAVAAGVKEAIADATADPSLDLTIFLSEAVSRGMEMHRQEIEEESDTD